MTKIISGEELSIHIRGVVSGTLTCGEYDVVVEGKDIPSVCNYLKTTPELEFNYLSAISAVDFIEYFEVIYHMTSLIHNHSVVLKTRIYDRDETSLPSVVDIWQGADLQEREIWDLMGIKFIGHYNLKRVLLWEGFPGHPLRKDFLEEVR
jgi:NADH-quinone oxidoreductase subunit C